MCSGWGLTSKSRNVLNRANPATEVWPRSHFILGKLHNSPGNGFRYILQKWLIVIDGCSKWPEVVVMMSITCSWEDNQFPDKQWHITHNNCTILSQLEWTGWTICASLPWRWGKEPYRKNCVNICAAQPKHSYSHWKDSCRTHVWQKNWDKIGSTTPTASEWPTISTDTEANKWGNSNEGSRTEIRRYCIPNFIITKMGPWKYKVLMTNKLIRDTLINFELVKRNQ